MVLSDGFKVVSILKISKVKILFDDGTVLAISAGHSLADGSLIRNLEGGDWIDNILHLIQHVSINSQHGN